MGFCKHGMGQGRLQHDKAFQGSTDVTLTFMALFCVRDLRRVQESC